MCTRVSKFMHKRSTEAACAGMMTLFTKALASSTAVSVTAIATAANLLLTGFISSAVFGATLTHTWIAGLVCVTLGTVLITAASPTAADTETPRQAGKEE
jgi:uncharacterized membrane protein